MSLPSRNRVRAAWIVAVMTDAIQLGLFPVTGTLSTWIDKPMDVAVMLVLWRLLGWHWAFLPSFVVELVPYAELTPSWTLAVWLATRRTSGATTTTIAGQAPRPADESSPSSRKG